MRFQLFQFLECLSLRSVFVVSSLEFHLCACFFWLVPIGSGDDLVDIMHLNLPIMLHSSSDGVSALEFHLCACFYASFDSVGC